MTIEKILNGEAATLVVVGRLDTQTAPELEKEVDDVVMPASVETEEEKALYLSALFCCIENYRSNRKHIYQGNGRRLGGNSTTENLCGRKMGRLRRDAQ